MLTAIFYFDFIFELCYVCLQRVAGVGCACEGHAHGGRRRWQVA